MSIPLPPDLVTIFADEYQRHLEVLRQAYFREEYSGFPWQLIADLSLGEACQLAPLFCELRVGPDSSFFAQQIDGVSPVQAPIALSGSERVAARCVRVVDLASYPLYGGDRDWTMFAKQVDRLQQQGVPHALLSLTVMSAAVVDGFRKRLHVGDDDPRGSSLDRLGDEEQQWISLVRAFLESVKAIGDKVNRPCQEFFASATIDWWQQHGTKLTQMSRELEARFQGDRDMFGVKGSIVEALKRASAAFTPGSGDRARHHLPMIYSAYEMALELVQKHWRKRGATPAVQRLFKEVGINLTDNAINLARRRHGAPGNSQQGNYVGEIG